VVDGDIQWEKYRPHEIVFAYTTTDAVDMRVGEWAYPGWRAEAMVEGAAKPVAISESEEGLRVLHLPGDTETVRMVYRAPRMGWVMAFCAWVVFSGFAGLLYLKRTDWFWIWLSRWMGRV
jgi:hypothetical protein